jgi:D-alanyl-D-alanine carboxypeptidase (penicillin-binding protein 5/6)
VLAVGVLVSGVVSAEAAQAASGPSGVTAKGGYLLDSGPNRGLWSKTADTKRQMASTTKIMTANVVLSTPGLNLNRKVTIKQAYRDYVYREGASTADLRTGDKVTVRQLLWAMLLPSGCDAAFALADTFGSGSSTAARRASFIGKMNSKARSLGMTRTKYDSFDGISAAGNNYTTPRDMAKLARSAMKSGTFKSIVKTTKTQQTATASNGNSRRYTWHSTNQLLGSYRGAIGIKTGTGTSAGPCLVFAATKGSRTVVGVILNDANRYRSAARMLDWAFGRRSAPTMKLRQLPAGAQRD